MRIQTSTYIVGLTCISSFALVIRLLSKLIMQKQLFIISFLTSSHCAQWLEKKGIIHERTVSYTPEQNGKMKKLEVIVQQLTLWRK